MIEFLGEEYFIDFDELTKFLRLEITSDKIKDSVTKVVDVHGEDGKLLTRTKTIEITPRPYEVNMVKYELIKNLIDDLGTLDAEDDPDLGANNLKNMTVRFKLAFNTLSNYNILKKS